MSKDHRLRDLRRQDGTRELQEEGSTRSRWTQHQGSSGDVLFIRGVWGLSSNCVDNRSFEQLGCFGVQHSECLLDGRLQRKSMDASWGPKSGSKAGTNMLVKKALCGLKSSGASFRAFLAETLDAMGFKPGCANPRVWLRPAVRKPDGFEHCECILRCVDNVPCALHDPL